MIECKVCKEFIFKSDKHKCAPLWDVVELEGYNGDKSYWYKVRGTDEEDAVISMCQNNPEFHDATEYFIVRNPETKVMCKVTITAEVMISYATEMENFEEVKEND